MVTVTEYLPSFETFHQELGYNPSSSLFFDIETTGFSPSSSVVFLIGALRFSEGSWILTQFLSENPQEEKTILDAFLSLASGYDTLVHFNGSAFDLPYIAKKAAQHHTVHTLEKFGTLDLYQSFRSLGKRLGLSRMNQRAIESFLGWEREDKLTGKDMASLYPKFAACGEPRIRDLLLLHNHDDMIGMTKLLQLGAYTKLFHGDILRINSACCVPPSCGISTESHRAQQNTPQACLSIEFTLKNPLPAPLCIDMFDTQTNGSLDFPFILSAKKDCAVLSIPFVCGILCYFFPDWKNYYYLPLEDQAIHKSVAGYVDSAYRTPAKASNCYIKKESVFLPQPDGLFTPSFRHSFSEKNTYFEFTDSFLSDNEKLSSYLQAVLRHIA